MTFERTKDYLFSGRRNADRARMPAKAMRETPSRAGGMAFRSMSLTIASILLCAMGCGCASAPEPRDYAADNSKAVRSPECPDLSGVYEGRVRQIVEGVDRDVAMPTIGVTLPLAEIYDGVAFPVGPRLVRMDEPGETAAGQA